MSAKQTVGLADTNILILRKHIDPAELPDSIAISAVTLAELAAGVHLVVGDSQEAIAERARRMDILQRAESEFDPLEFDAVAARIYGRIAAAVAAVGRSPRRRIADLLIAATAAANELPVYTTNPTDYQGLDGIVAIIPVSVSKSP